MQKIFLIIILFLSSFALNAQGEKFKTEDAVAFSKTIKSPNVVVVDVRAVNEYKDAHLPKSVNLDVQDPNFITKVINMSKGKSVAIYCRNGAKSKVAAMKLSYKGVKVILLDKGVADWKGTMVK